MYSLFLPVELVAELAVRFTNACKSAIRRAGGAIIFDRPEGLSRDDP